MKKEVIGKGIIVVLVIAGVILFNLLTFPLREKIDLSYGKAYTLSPSTRKVLRSLSDTVLIEFFSSSNLPTRLKPLKREIVDLLEEYKRASKDVTLKILDPSKDSKAEEEARNFGIPQLQFSLVERDKYAVSNGYFGIGITYAGKKEVIPKVDNISNLEYELTSLIYKLSKKNPDNVYLYVGQAGVGEKDDFSLFKQGLQKEFSYKLLPSRITGLETKEARALVLVDDRKKSFKKEEIDTLSQYLKKGGNIIAFIDGVWVSDSLMVKKAEHNLFSLLKENGLVLHKDLVLSNSSSLVNFGNQYISFLAPYPFWVKTSVFNKEAPYFANVYSLSFPWVSSISLRSSKNISTRFLVKTTPYSWEESDNFILAPNQISRPSKSDLKSFIIGAEATRKKGGKILLFSSSRFLYNRFLSHTSNLNFVLNLLDNLCSSGLLSGIRTRGVRFYSLPKFSPVQEDIFRYGNLIVPFILTSLLGLAYFLRKKSSKIVIVKE